MPDLDLEPEQYRASPLKGEPVFHPYGKRILVLVVGLILVGVFLRFVLHEPIGQLVAWAWPKG